MRQILFAVLMCLTAFVVPAHAVEPDEMLDDPKLEQRARDLSAKLRCLVCQNQSIDDSNADLAKDLRVLVRERLKEGDTDSEVIDFLVDRYGQFVLLAPRFSAQTVLLYVGAPAVLVLGIIAIVVGYRRRNTQVAAKDTAALSDDEAAELARVMADKEEK
ncbi:MAG: cytochrome c-type biogenesis protein CcmH [Hyphomicrobiales bacterium]|nr:MAG: cytochrome c-type biogenesis protein CcmH [Hyphomicrobiales bacterium]